MAEAFNSLFKAKLVRNLGPWIGIDDLESTVAEYIDWFNDRRLHDQISLIFPVKAVEQLLFKPTRQQIDGTGLTEPLTNPRRTTGIVGHRLAYRSADS